MPEFKHSNPKVALPQLTNLNVSNIKKFMKLFQNQKGQGMVEYILIVGLIALMVFVAIKTLGTNIKTGFTNAATKVTDATSW
jgi:pilus assembly protein Flp/PilA